MDICKLGDIAKFTTGKLNSNAAQDNGKYPFFTCAPEALKIDDYAFDTEAIILAGNNADGNFHIQHFKGKFNAYQRTYALLAFVVIDYLTGVMCAVSDRKLSSAVGFRGICRKVLIFLLVGIANILDVQVIGTGSVLRTAVVFFYLSNEGVSLLENASHLGLPVPEKIKEVLEQLHDRSEKGE